MGKVIFPSFLWDSLRDIIRESDHEKAFFIIGTVWQDKIIIYDLIEFRYHHHNSTSVIGDPYQKVLLVQAIPPGLRILGIMHSHPFEIDQPEFSSIDLNDFEEFGEGLFIVVSREMKYKAVITFNGRLEECELVIRDLTGDEEPRIISVNERWKLVIPNGSSRWEIENYSGIYLSTIIANEASLGKLVIRGNVAELKLPEYYDLIKSWSKYKIPYRIYLANENKDVLNAVKLIISYMFNYNDCEINYLENKREIIIHTCKGRYI